MSCSSVRVHVLYYRKKISYTNSKLSFAKKMFAALLALQTVFFFFTLLGFSVGYYAVV